MIRPNDIMLDLNGSLTEQLKTNSQQAINDVVAALGVTGPTESVKESRESGNGITLANGDYGGWMSEKSGSVYKALGAMSKVVKPVTGAAANVNTIGCHDKTGGGFAGTTATGNL